MAHAQQAEDGQNIVLYDSGAMTVRPIPNADAQTAMQYLIWALEIIGKAGNQKAAKHARIALEALRDGVTQSGETADDSAT